MDITFDHFLGTLVGGFIVWVVMKAKLLIALDDIKKEQAKKDAERQQLSERIKEDRRIQAEQAERQADENALNDMSKHENQIRYLKQADKLLLMPLMGYKPYKYVFKPLEDFLKEQNKGERLCPETCMGSFIRSYPLEQEEPNDDEKRIHSAYNCKRLDFLIIDYRGNPLVALEYQGKGHFKGNYKERDEVKRLTCEIANIPLIEVEQKAEFNSFLPEIQAALAYSRGRYNS